MTDFDLRRPEPAPARPRRPQSRFRTALMASALGLALAIPAFGPAGAQSQMGAQNLTQQVKSQPGGLQSLSPIVDKVMPAVVNISVASRADTPDEPSAQNEADNGDQGGGPGFPQSPFDEFLRRFFDQQIPGMPGGPGPQHGPRGGGAKRVALGSGFIIDPQGYVVTNNHVVADSGTVTVIFQDNTKHPAKIVGRDPKTDLALLKIDTKKPLPYVEWGDSDAAKVGDWIIAVGNPFGLGGTVTTGIVSARGRDIHSGPFDDFLQLDAAINRGNSGGPTFNMNGQVIGINTAIYSPNGGSVGIGFAIPSSLAKNIVAQLREHGSVERGWLGVQIQGVTPEIASNLGLKDPQGALVADVQPDSPAAKAGLKQGDVITAYDGHPVKEVRDLPRLVAETKVGQPAQISVWRGGKEQKVEANVGRMKEEKQASAADGNGGNDQQQASPERASALGIQLSRLDDRTRQRLGLKGGVKGVVVTGVKPDSPAADIGIEPGDVIMAINQQPVTSPGEAAKKINEAQQSGNKNVLLLLNRRGTSEYVGIQVG